jgi:hypothetical protein
VLDTLHRILVRHGEQRLKRLTLTRKGEKRHSRPATECSSMSASLFWPSISTPRSMTARDTEFSASIPAANTLDFLERLIKEMPFPVERIQTP